MKLTIYSIILISTFFTGALNLSAQGKNDDFYTKYDPQESIIYFVWFGNGNQNVTQQFTIWHAEGLYKEFDANTFTEFAKTNSSDTKPTNGQYVYKMDYKLDLNIEHSFCLQISEPNGNSRYSNVFILNKIEVEPSQKIAFTIFPDDKAVLNKPYSSKIEAQYTDDPTKTINYELKSGPDGLTIDKSSGEINWTPNSTKYNQVWIRAYLSENPKIFADYYYQIRVRTCEKPVIISGLITNKFDEPVSSGYLVLYSNTPNGEKPEEKMGVEVKDGIYSIEVDEGVYYMIFYDQMGRYFVYENATNNEGMKPITVECGKNLTIDWKITNYSDRMFQVSGKVLDKEGNPVPNWTVFFQSKMEEGEKEGFYNFNAITDNEGNYSIKLPDGTSYYAFTFTQNSNFNRYNFNTLYYNQTFDVTKATKLVLTGDLSNIDFKFIDNPDIKFYTVKGKVLDENNTPLEGVMVSFEGFNEKENKNNYYKYYDQVFSDAQGNYEIKLPSMFKYIGYAVNSAITNNSKEKWMPLFYDQTYNREEAKIITLTEDLSGINFTFKSTNTVYNNFIKGTVTDTANSPISFAFVEAVNIEEEQHFDKAHHFHYGFTDDNGNFTIKGLEPGKYVIFASTQHSNEFLCGYYVENTIASIQYDEATRLEVNETSNIEGINIILPKFTTKNGGGIIKGQIYNNNNYSESNKANSAVVSAKIYLKENVNSLASFQESNADGSFVISNLSTGTYTFVVDKTGFQKYEKVVEVTDSNPVDLGLILLVPIGGNSVNDNSLSSSQLYPNPTKSEVNLSFVSASNTVLINFYDMAGNIVKTINTPVTIGNNTLLINLDALTSGKYIATVNDGKQIVSIPVILQK